MYLLVKIVIFIDLPMDKCSKKINQKFISLSLVHFPFQIPIVSSEACRNVYVDYRITDNMFCAGYRRGKMDSCAGDSGGPILCQDPRRPNRPWTIFGITSFGEGCGKRGKFGIYARLSNYVRWISKVMKETDDYD